MTIFIPSRDSGPCVHPSQMEPFWCRRGTRLGFGPVTGWHRQDKGTGHCSVLHGLTCFSTGTLPRNYDAIIIIIADLLLSSSLHHHMGQSRRGYGFVLLIFYSSTVLDEHAWISSLSTPFETSASSLVLPFQTTFYSGYTRAVKRIEVFTSSKL